MMACKSVCRVLYRRLASSAAEARISAAELRRLRNTVFSKEQARQRALITRTEKIEVTLQGPGLQGSLLVMNKGVSTPHSCARHLTEWHVENSALALVDGEPWPMHRPLTQSCSLTLLTFKDPDPVLVNKAYWRSCSALLGQVLENAFKDEFIIQLLKSPELPVTSGAFCCDLVLDPLLDAWTPSEEALRSLTRDAHQLIQQNLPWEPLEVSPPVALEAFAHSRCKQEEVEEMVAENPHGTVTLYRCGDHVLLSGGPLVARTGLCSQYEVTALHNLGQGERGLHRRAQGLSLPLQLQAHHEVWRKLRKRAEKLVELTPSSAAEATPPVSEAPLPASEAPTPAVEATPPAPEDTPTASEAIPQASEAPTSAVEATPPASEAPTSAVEATPPASEATPQASEAPTPAVEATPTASEATPTASEATPTASEATPTASEATPQASEAPTPAVEATPPASEATPTASEATPQASEAPTPAVEDTPPATEAQSPDPQQITSTPRQ